MDKVLKGLPAHWSGRRCIEFYSVCRRTVKDLYDSEKVFLPRMLKKGMRVLDVGCAAGGFCNIMKEIEPGISYYGCDFTERLIREAKKEYARAHFAVADSVRLPYKENSFDLVNCAGTCHMIPDYLNAIRQMYGVSRRFCIFDVRITDKTIDFDVNRCYQMLSFGSDRQDGGPRSPYIVLNARDFLKQLLGGLSPKPKSIYATGYLRAPAATAVVPLSEVCMAVFMIEKGSAVSGGRTEICMDMPYYHMEDEEFRDELWFGPRELYERLGQK